MKGYNNNPRQITTKQYKALCVSLDELGDLSGIVHNIPTDEIIGGNQRMRALDLKDEDIVITEQYDEPTRAGTVALGYVERHGEKFGYRAVAWDAETCRLANLRANHLGGSDDWDILAGWDMETLEAGGVDLELLHTWNEGAENLREMYQAQEADAVDIDEEKDDEDIPLYNHYNCPKCGFVFSIEK